MPGNGRVHKPAPKKPGKVFDVRKPGKTPAPPTSRPVIAGHKPGAQAAQIAVSGIGEARQLLDPRHKVKVEVRPEPDAPNTAPAITSEAEAIGGEAVRVSVSPPDVSIASPENSVKPPEPISPPPAPEASVPQPQTNEQPGLNLPNDLSVPQIPKPQTFEVEDNIPPELEPIPESTITPIQPALQPSQGDIIVSHHAGSGAGLQILFMLLLILLLAAAAVNILIDAGILGWDFIPHSDFLQSN